MSVAVPGSTSGSMISEYAATNITFNRQMIQNASGFLEAVFIANISYEKKTYVVDANNNKLGIVVAQDQGMMPPQNDLSRGYVNLDATTFAQYFSKTANQGDILGVLVASLADDLIHQDLINRKILTA